MRLGDHDFDKIISKIIAGGGEEFLNSLSFCVVPLSKEHRSCCTTCDRTIGRHGRAYVITNPEALRIFDDLYHNPECVKLAIKWAHCLYEAFQKYLGFAETRKLTIADLSDPLVRVSLKQFKFQHLVHVQRLKEFTMEIRRKKQTHQ